MGGGGRGEGELMCKRVGSSGVKYHWQELTQVSFLSRQTRICRDKFEFVATKHVFCRDKSIMTKMILVAAPATDSKRERERVTTGGEG